MRVPKLHQRESIILALAVGGLIGLGKDLAAGVAHLYHFALTPQGNAALLVAAVLVSCTCLFVTVLGR